MQDNDEFNTIYILKIIEDINVISPAMFSTRNRPSGVKEGGFAKWGVIAELSDCIAFFCKPFRVPGLIRLANKVNFSCQKSNSQQEPP
jgi:hypothetical protein